ncbi:MAG: TMEM198/TM7SF3 family protein [Phycisphaerales bacterium]|nr:TMEM198/TM7SF3 family protein [Phycisphaerales bacterium]MCI0675319.1 TMEM198/TM7SF3 family protein [Phycisphaerales bacterium]
MITSPLSFGAADLTLAMQMNTFQDAMRQLDILTQPDKLLDNLAKLPMIAASMIVVVGFLCVLNGYKWHKWVVIALAFMLGVGVGNILSQQMGKSAIVAIALGVLFACIATPMLRWTVAIFGGLTGAFLGANAWTLANANPPNAQWAGACMGFIALALLSFVVFRLVVVLFTSIGGAAMVVLGVITLLMQVPGWEPIVRQGLANNQHLVPLLVTVAAVAGFVIQESRVRNGDGGGEEAKAH